MAAHPQQLAVDRDELVAEVTDLADGDFDGVAVGGGQALGQFERPLLVVGAAEVITGVGGAVVEQRGVYPLRPGVPGAHEIQVQPAQRPTLHRVRRGDPRLRDAFIGQQLAQVTGIGPVGLGSFLAAPQPGSTTGFCTRTPLRPRLPDPGRLEVPARPVVVEAAPTRPCASRVRLPPASAACCDRPQVGPFHHPVVWRLVAHR